MVEQSNNKKQAVNQPPSIPHLTAKSWSIVDVSTGDLLGGKNEHQKREMASITKIMTCYTVVQIIKKLDINVLATKIEVSYSSYCMNGTSAKLCEGDVLSLWDMLHGLMLPSGNDAAIALAEFFGELILELSLPSSGLKELSYLKMHPVEVFVKEMNKNAKKLKLNQTQYANPHGLSNTMNKSCALDIARLASISMQEAMVRQIVRRRKYSCIALDMFGNEKAYFWENTNKLLSGKGYNGVKTGITPVAGPCLCSSYQTSELWVIMVALCSRTTDLKWSETVRLTEYAVDLINYKKLTGGNENPEPVLPIIPNRDQSAHSNSNNKYKKIKEPNYGIQNQGSYNGGMAGGGGGGEGYTKSRYSGSPLKKLPIPKMDDPNTNKYRAKGRNTGTQSPGEIDLSPKKN